MSRSRRTMRSPSTMTLKFTGSLRAGCWGPIGSSTSGMLLTSGGWRLPVLAQRVLPLRPPLVQEEAAGVREAFELDPEEVVALPLVQARDGEEGRDRGDRRRRLRHRSMQRDHDATRPAQVVHDLEIRAEVQ